MELPLGASEALLVWMHGAVSLLNLKLDLELL